MTSTRSSSRTAPRAAVLSFLCLIAWPARAEPPPSAPAAELDAAKDFYKEGKELRQRGDLRGALERFKAAHAYGNTPVTAFDLGIAYLQVGEMLVARETFASIAAIPVASDETEKSAKARSQAGKLVEQLRTQIPTIVVGIDGGGEGVSPQVLVDGMSTPVVDHFARRKVNPGEHVVVARLAGHEETRTIAIADYQTKELHIGFSPEPERLDKAPPPPPSAAPMRTIHPLTWAGLALGGAGLVVGSVGALLAAGKANAVTDGCGDAGCSASGRRDASAASTLATVSTIGVISAAVGIGLAALGYFVLSPRSRHLTTTPPLPVPVLLQAQAP